MLTQVQTTSPRRPFSYAAFPAESLDSLFVLVVEEDDYAAFEKIFKSCYKSLCGFANQIVRSRELAEEIVDDVFYNLWKNRKKIQINASFRPYLLTSVRNKSLDCLRKMKHEKR